MPPPIAKLANDILDHPVRIDVARPRVAVDRIEQRVFFVGAKEKRALLDELLADRRMDRVLVFTRTKRGADRVCQQSEAGRHRHGGALHGNKAQNARVRALDAFRNGKVRILVATDIAARGIDVPNISHVINYELPNEPESYVHRIGRTARAGAGGAALSFCDQSERPYLQAIERLMQLNGHRRRASSCRHAAEAAAERRIAAAGHSKRTAPGKRRRRSRMAGTLPKSPCWRRRPPGAGASLPIRGGHEMSKPTSGASAARRNAEALLSKTQEAGTDLQARAGARE